MPVPDKSIAVLPFENLSMRKNAYFADGVQDEILTDLAKIADLKVISRTTVMHYKSGSRTQSAGDRSATRSRACGGRKRSALGNRVRVNAQLVDARTDRHLWAQTYDRDLADVFAIQSEIAKAIADELQAKLLPTEESEIQRPSDDDITAFDLYTRAKNLILTPFSSSDGRTDLLEALDLLNQSVARDPSFFRGYCQLAFVHDALYFLGHDHTSCASGPWRKQPFKRPLASVRMQANYTSRVRGIFTGDTSIIDGALAELEVARRTLPNDPQLLVLTGFIQRRQGRWEESTEPLSAPLISTHATRGR